MKEEIEAGVKFLREFLAKYGQLTTLQIEQFVTKLTRLLNERYANHWYESQPLKGQAFRCLRLKRADNYIDPALEQILRECGLSLNQLGLTNDFTLWIDPGEVSVRFGDQIGYTYTIARFERTSETQTKTKTAADEVEKIFDDKLTAFIRQNSTSVAATNVKQPVVETEPEVEASTSTSSSSSSSSSSSKNEADNNGNKRDEEVISDAVASLSIDQQQHCSKSSVLSSDSLNRRINLSSSNISITNPSNLVAGVQNTNEMEFGELTALNNNRQSYNDSCYYSSSSSSCASSFDAAHDGPLSWMTKASDLFITPSQQQSSDYHQSSSIPKTSRSLFSPSSALFPADNNATANDSSNNQQLLIPPFDQIDPFMVESALYPVGGTLFGSSALGPVGGGVGLNTISDRSDTPNSCTSSTNSNPYYQQPAPPQPQRPYSSILTTDAQSGSSSSDASTSTAVQSSPGSFAKSPQIGEEIAKQKSKGKKKKEGKSSSKTTTTSSPSSSLSSSSNNNNNNNSNKEQTPLPQSNGSKKDDSYCGYVESFPYYYKLNRLYNALAVQKMQTERMKKSGMLKVTGGGGGGGGSGSGGAGTPTGSRPGSSLSSRIELASSPVANNNATPDVTQLLLKQHPLGQVLSTSLQNTTGINHHMQAAAAAAALAKQQQQPFGSPGNFRFLQQSYKEAITPPSGTATPATTTTASTTSPTKNGYPMSPTNAAISFANHHHRMGASSSATIKDSPNRHYQQHHHQQQQQYQFKQSQQQQQQPQHFSPLFSNLATAIDLDINKNSSNSFHELTSGRGFAPPQIQPPTFQQQQFGSALSNNFQSGTSLPLQSAMKSFINKAPTNSTSSFLGADLFDFTTTGLFGGQPSHDLLKTGTD